METKNICAQFARVAGKTVAVAFGQLDKRDALWRDSWVVKPWGEDAVPVSSTYNLLAEWGLWTIDGIEECDGTVCLRLTKDF